MTTSRWLSITKTPRGPKAKSRRIRSLYCCPGCGLRVVEGRILTNPDSDYKKRMLADMLTLSAATMSQSPQSGSET